MAIKATNSTSTIYVDYDIDWGMDTGTMEFAVDDIEQVYRKREYFPASTYGTTMELNVRNEDKDSRVTIQDGEVRFREEPMD